MTRVVCFDLDDTLVAEADYVESGLRAVGEALSARGPLRTADPGGWLVARWRATRAGDVIQELLDAEGIPREPAAGQMIAVYRDHVPRIALRDGALDLLRFLHERGDRLALVSDGYLGTQRRKWEALSVPVPFHPVVFTDEMGRERWKPHPWGFERVMEAWPGAESYAYVADNPVKDFVSPNRLGWKTIELVHPGNVRPRIAARGEAAARHVAEGFARLKEIL